jgi:hypothetical protein
MAGLISKPLDINRNILVIILSGSALHTLERLSILS